MHSTTVETSSKTYILRISAINRKYTGMFHVTHTVQHMLRYLRWKVLDPLKKVLNSNRFRSDEDIKSVVMRWFQQQHRDIFVKEIPWLVCLP
jgi:hypothetical protein